MAIRRHWKQSFFASLREKQNFAAKDIAKILTMCLNIQLKTDVEIRFSFDGADHYLHVSYVCLPKKGDPYFSRAEEQVIIVNDVTYNTDEIITQLQYLLDNRERK